MTYLPDFDKLWDYEHPDETERTFRALLPGTEKKLSYQLELLTQIARAQGLQNHFGEAHSTLDHVERRLTVDTPTAHVRMLLERGRVYNSAGDPGRARRYFEEAWKIAQDMDEIGYAVDAGHMLGILETPALDWNLRTLKLAERSSDPRARRWLASLYNNIGWTYHDRGEYNKALETFEKALAECEQQGKPRRIQIARWTIGRTLRSLNRIDEALAVQQQLAAELEQSGVSDGFAQEELGECLLALERADEAKPHFARAYALLLQDDYLVQNEPERIERLRTLGEG